MKGFGLGFLRVVRNMAPQPSSAGFELWAFVLSGIYKRYMALHRGILTTLRLIIALQGFGLRVLVQPRHVCVPRLG